MRRLFSNFQNFLALGLAVQFSGCRAEQTVADNIPKNSLETIPLCVRIIQGHVAKTRRWKIAEYQILEERAPVGRKGFSVWHTDDNVLRPPGGTGKSFHIELDSECKTILGAWRYQQIEGWAKKEVEMTPETGVAS